MKFNYPITIEETTEWAGQDIFTKGKTLFHEGRVNNLNVSANNITAKVHDQNNREYKVDIKSYDGHAECTCNCDYEWNDLCIHGVAVLLFYLDLHGISNNSSEVINFLAKLSFKKRTHPIFKYSLKMDSNSHSVFFQIFDINANRWVTNLEGWLPRHSFQSKTHTKNLLPADRALFAFLMPKTNNNRQGFFLDQQEFTELLLILQNSTQLKNTLTGKTLLISPEKIKHTLEISKQTQGLCQLKLTLTTKDKTIPLAGSKTFGQHWGWLLHRDTFYSIPSVELIKYFQKHPNLKLNHNEAFLFIKNHIHTLTQNITIALPPGWKNCTLEKHKPTPVLKLEAKGYKLSAQLEFDYGGRGTVSYTHSSLYFKGKNEEIWLQRDKEFEQKIAGQLRYFGFYFNGKNQWLMEGEKIISFLSKQLPKLVKQWKVLSTKDISKFRVSKNTLSSNFSLKSGTNWFDLSPFYRAGDNIITHDELRRLVNHGKKYVQLKDGSHSPIPLEIFQKNEKILQEIGANKPGKIQRVGLFHLIYSVQALHAHQQIELDKKLQTVLQKIQHFEHLKKITLTAHAKKWLRPYQIKGLYWLWFLREFGFGGILADDMGLGKTFQTLFLLEKANSTKPALVVCPTSVIWNWQREIDRLMPSMKTLIWSGNDRKKQKAKLKKVKIVLTTYALLRRDIDLLNKIDYEYVILDEAQNIKNALSQTAKAAKNLNSDHRLALTGTPIENHLTELWSIYDFLMPGFLGTQTFFRENYLIPIERMDDDEKVLELKNKIQPFILRRIKQQVLKELPPKNEIVALCELTKEQAEQYRDILQSTKKSLFKQIKESSVEKNQINILTALLKLRQVCCHPLLLKGKPKKYPEPSSAKFELFKETVSEIIEEKHRILVFSQFVEMLTILKNWALEEKIPFYYLDGSTKNRQQIIDAFQAEEKPCIFFLSLKAGGTGLNLTNADYVIHYDPWWNPAVENQATDRTHRIGQKKKVFVYKMLTKGTVEEKILNLQKKKKKLSEGVISKEKTFGKMITRRDLEDLFNY